MRKNKRPRGIPIDEVAERVRAILDRLQRVPESTDRAGRPTWRWLRAGDRCWRCGRKVGSEVQPESMVCHHVIPKQEGGLDTPDNVSRVCSDCHAFIHNVLYGTVGESRSRSNEGRRIGKSLGEVTITRLMKDTGVSLQRCEKCGAAGRIDGVLDNYFDGDAGILITLTCTSCSHGFAVPFVRVQDVRSA